MINLFRTKRFESFYLFYIFITVLLGSLAVIGFRALAAAGQSGLALLNLGLFVCHIGLHWLMIREEISTRGWAFYYIAQTVLILALTFFPYGPKFAGGLDFGASILGSTVVTMMGEALGRFGNSGTALKILLFYLALMAGILLLILNSAEVVDYFYTMAINGGFILLLIYFFNEQTAGREKAEQLAAELETANRKLAINATRIEELTLTTERQRMARDLHDTLAQGVAGLILQLEAVKAHIGADRTERAGEIVAQALSRARNTLSESRAAIDDLRQSPANLAEAVQSQTERFTQATGIPCRLNLVNETSVDREIGEHALHILSEGLANVTRHAQATEVWVDFLAKPGTLLVQVRDNGAGFNPATSEKIGHYGLIGMRERARLIGGTFSVESAPDRGTTIRLETDLE